MQPAVCSEDYRMKTPSVFTLCDQHSHHSGAALMVWFFHHLLSRAEALTLQLIVFRSVLGVSDFVLHNLDQPHIMDQILCHMTIGPRP